ncbi:RNA-binding KH domain-containing protein RCF3-like isoform X2 [Cynara cardunculus var. scolymus]|uniref:K Homology domain-containing protein n=1 Tax=Cynara cardunculus var. scolymus TaxID=59895 RepID=A0A103XXU9_CYNCS|nr:RNA-binding KH domain-containing protein RCF3-like isoform X2 [Cynara cardunculus var. scolymus]KVH98805.1 hypothetical protein Ccrd_022967 [Cynara cardunculus var. scolymus]
MSSKLTPSKRPQDRGASEGNGKGKWQKSAYFTSQDTSFKIAPGSTVFRVLCPASKAGSVIGKGGDKISQIRQETGAKVRVEEIVPGCNERVVVIAGSDEDNQRKNADEGTKAVLETEDTDKTKEHDEGSEHKQSVAGEDLPSEKVASSVQKALFLVFERMFGGEPGMDGGNEDGNKEATTCVVRLLVLSSQVGCLLGKAGSVIKQMASESGSQIRILPRDKLPACASPSDELIQLSGDMDAVKKALQSVSQQLLDHPPRDDDSFSANPSGLSHSFGNSLSRPDAYPAFPHGRPLAAPPADGVGGAFGRMGLSQEMLTYRLICPDEKVGGVIGKGGSVVKALQQETGCDIKVLELTADSDDRVIVISGPSHPDERISAPQDAVLRVQTRIIRAAPENKEQGPTGKIIVSSHQIGCLLGKGGAVISEMRKSTGAYIRILGKDQTPQYAARNEEVVQINGDFDAVHEALLQITMRLRSHFFRDAFPSINHPPNSSFPDHGPPFPPYMRREVSPPGRYSSFTQFDAGMPPHGGFHPHDDHPPFMHDLHRPGFSHHMPERLPASAPWGPPCVEGGGPLGFPEFSGVPQRRLGGFGGGNHQAIITSTTVEVVVPRSVVSAIYGEDGGCLKQIREISDAKITITETKGGGKETLIIISGTPEQTHAAQSLIQAFVISETETC